MVLAVVWYGAGVDPDDFRLVALTVMESGLKIQQIASSKGPQGRSGVISIGTDTDWL